MAAVRGARRFPSPPASTIARVRSGICLALRGNPSKPRARYLLGGGPSTFSRRSSQKPPGDNQTQVGDYTKVITLHRSDGRYARREIWPTVKETSCAGWASGQLEEMWHAAGSTNSNAVGCQPVAGSEARIPAPP